MKSLRPFRPVTPGEVLKEELDSRCWTQPEFAKIIGRPIQEVNEIISGHKAIVHEIAVDLSRAIGTSPEFWLNLEAAYRLDLKHHVRSDTKSSAL
jgi:HTH-type transcriptional regulator/antitoxin HigA